MELRVDKGLGLEAQHPQQEPAEHNDPHHKATPAEDIYPFVDHHRPVEYRS